MYLNPPPPRRSARIANRNNIQSGATSTQAPPWALVSAQDYDRWNLEHLGLESIQAPGPSNSSNTLIITRTHSNHKVKGNPKITHQFPVRVAPSRNVTMKNTPNHIPRNLGKSTNSIALQWNMNGFFNNLADLERITLLKRPAYICLQELHNVSTQQLDRALGGQYKWVQSRGSGYQSAGLGVHRSVPFKKIAINPEFPVVAIETKYPVPMTVISYYVPNRTVNAGHKLIKALEPVTGPMIIMGDANGHHSRWGSPLNNLQGSSIADAAEELDLVVMNDGSPTYCSGSTETAIDVTLTSSCLLHHFSWAIDDDLAGSDHHPIHILSTDSHPTMTKRPRWIYESANWNSFANDFTEYFRNEPPGSLTDMMNAVHQAAVDNIPKSGTTIGTRNTNWWCNDTDEAVALRKTTFKALKKQLKKIRRLEKKNVVVPLLYITKAQEAKAAFAAARNRCRAIIKKAKNDSWKAFLDGIHPDQSSQQLWDKINRLSGKRKNFGYGIHFNGRISRDPSVVAEQLSEYFAELSSHNAYPDSFKRNHPPANTELRNISIPECNLSLNKPFGMNELCHALSRGHGKSLGVDEIGYPMLKNLPTIGKIHLLDLINKEWTERTIPMQWKHSLITPIPKKEKTNGTAASFRPISLTCCVGKVMERMVNRRLINWLNECSWFDHRQHAFRAGRGVGSYFTDLGEILELGMSTGHVEIAALDIEKAYNRIWTPNVVRKLINEGLGGNIIHFLVNFLTDRTFQVCVGNFRSSTKTEETGIPQGSVIAVTAFLVGVCGVFEKIPRNMYALMYADDIALIAVCKTEKATRLKIQAAVNAATRWANDTGFNISAPKCELVHICNSKHKVLGTPVRSNGTRIPMRKSIRLLGVHIDRALNFDKHIFETRRNCKTRINLIKAISKRHQRCNRQTILRVAEAIIDSRLIFGIELTGIAYEKITASFAPIHNNAIRIASGLLPGTPADAACAESGCLPFRFKIQKTLINRAVSHLTRTTGNYLNTLDRTGQRLYRHLTNYNMPRMDKVLWVGETNWDRPPIKTNKSLEVKFKRKKDIPLSLLKNEGLKVLDRYKSHCIRYTDGSKSKDGRVGLGVAGDISISLRLPDTTSVFSAEAAAILHAIKHPPSKPLLVVTDSLSVIKALRADHSAHPWIQTIQDIGKDHTYMWAPSHCGIPGNEAADKLANNGRHSWIPHTNSTAPDVKRDIKNKINTKWALEWANSTFPLRKIKNTPERWEDPVSQMDQRVISRLRVGMTRFTNNMTGHGPFRVMCPICQVRNTVEHVLIVCPNYHEQRECNGIPTNIRTALSEDASALAQVIQFMKDAKLYYET